MYVNWVWMLPCRREKVEKKLGGTEGGGSDGNILLGSREAVSVEVSFRDSSHQEPFWKPFMQGPSRLLYSAPPAVEYEHDDGPAWRRRRRHIRERPFLGRAPCTSLNGHLLYFT